MKNVWIGASALALTAGMAQAGALERANNNYGLLFESGDQIELSFTSVNPNVSGDYEPALGGGSTDDMANSYTSLGFGYKNDLSDKLSFGLFINKPYGADSEYTAGVYAGLTAEWDSNQTALVGKYSFSDNVSVFGGLRYVRSSADIVIPELLVRGASGAYAQGLGAQAQALGVQAQDLGAQAAAAQAAGDLALAQQLGAQAQALGAQAQSLGARAQTIGAAADPATNPLGDPGMTYTAKGSQTGDWGYILGAAYERKDIAMRVSLTYESAIEHKFSTSESLASLGIPTSSKTEVTMPQSLTLEARSGVAPGTLVFGSIKWTEWSEWEVRTPGYESVTGGEITGFKSDIVTWKLGAARRFSENLVGIGQLTYEAPNGDTVSRLSPTDGRTSIGLALQYEQDNVKMRGGVEYVSLGGGEDSSGTKFRSNDAWGIGASITFGF